MKHLTFLIFYITISLTTFAQSSLQFGFKDPPASAKARTWWHWIDGNVSKAGITADLEAMKAVGIQEAQIFNVGQGYPEGPATFMSPMWLDMVHFAAAEAKRLGLEMAIHNGPGWSSSGGPWVTPEFSMQTIVISETHYEGKRKIKEKLLQPESKFGYYKDIAVIAFPTPLHEQKIDNLEEKALFKQSFKSRMQPDSKLIDKSAIIHKKDIIFLTEKMSVDGTLEWNIPSGKWTVLRIGHTANGTENRPAGKGGKGLECDKLSRVAVDAYWKGGVQPIIDKLGNLVGESLTNCIIDSYEVGNCNWTQGLNDEFAIRCGYDCMDFLPTFAGYYVESGEITERFLWDFRKTIGDLMADNYYGYFAELCHQHGLKLSVEPYGGPFDAFQVGSKADIVMSEFWVGNNVFLDSPKLVASIAHLNGKSIVGAESFTSVGGWKNHPATLKQIGDWVWTEGVNRLIFHTYVHQPWDVPPGVTFHMYGLDMNRHNTWWTQGKAYMDYLARSQFMLQQGRSVADVLVFVGESSPNDGILKQEIKALGYDYDEIGIDQLKDLTVNDGRIVTRAGGKYKVLILPQTEWMTPETLAKIDKLVKSGAIVAGPKPLKSPSLCNYPKCDDSVRELTATLWGGEKKSDTSEGRIIDGRSIQEILQYAASIPDFSRENSGEDLNFIHRTKDGADIYFIANPRKESRQEICRFRVNGKYPQIWNPETGEIREVAVWKEENSCVTIPLSFESEESLFVVFENNRLVQTPYITEAKTNLKPILLQPISGLEILKAEYGIFLPDGLADVTEALDKHVQGNKLDIWVGNDLSSGDPASGSVKELRIEYEANGARLLLKAAENSQLKLDTKNGFKIIRGVYGKFPEDMTGVPPKQDIHDVAKKLTSMLTANQLIIRVDDNLIDRDVDYNSEKKELRLVYITEGERHSEVIPQNREVNFALRIPTPRIVSEKGKTFWVTPYAGNVEYKTSSGKKQSIEVKTTPKPIDLTGDWDVNFPLNKDKSEETVFKELTSWTSSTLDEVRHFSGTATYRKKVSIPSKFVGDDYSLELDLGSVRVIAEVIVNGQNLGILWKAPFRVSLENVVKTGENEIEVRVTNLWANRLIGDDRLPEDFEWGEWTLKSWPAWLINGEKRNSERTTFTTWKHWNKDSPLQLSGLLGPVQIRPYVKKAFDF